MMYGRKRHWHGPESMNVTPGLGRKARSRGMHGHRYDAMVEGGGRRGPGPCWEEDIEARRTWLETRKQHLQARLADVEAELAALNKAGLS